MILPLILPLCDPLFQVEHVEVEERFSQHRSRLPILMSFFTVMVVMSITFLMLYWNYFDKHGIRTKNPLYLSMAKQETEHDQNSFE